MTELQAKMWEALTNTSSERATAALLNFHGLQLLTDEFAEFLIDEGIMADEADWEEWAD